jgi:cysteinyl-tRNA synthetase
LDSLGRSGEHETDERAAELMVEREAARAGKDFARADAIRDELAELGYEVRDSSEGPRLVPKA